MTAPAPRIISFLQLAQEADPDYWRNATQPKQYEFSNGRMFRRAPNPYLPVATSGTST